MAINRENFQAAVLVDGKQAGQEIEKIRRKVAELSAEKEKLKQKQLSVGLDEKELKRLERLSDQLATQERRLSRVKAVGREVYDTLGRLDQASPKELQRTLEALERTMESGKVKRGTEQWELYRRKAAEVRAELESVREEMHTAGDAAEQSGSRAQKAAEAVKNAFLGVKNAFAGVSFAKDLAEPYVQKFAELDTELVGVAKYTGLTRQEVQELNEELKKIDTSTSLVSLNQLAQEAGRLGLTAKEDILDFVQAANTINVALGEDLGEDAVRNIGKLATMFGEVKRLGIGTAMLATGSAINELGQNTAATEGYLVEFTNRLAAVAAQAGLTQAEIIAYAATLDSNAVGVEKAATALQNVITNIYREPAAAAQAAGLEVEAFTELLRTNANEALLQWAEGFARVNPELNDAAPALKNLKMAGSGVTQTILTLAQNTSLLRQNQEMANQAYREATSVANEQAQAESSTANQIARLRNEQENLAATLGEKLTPLYIELLQIGNSVVGFFTTLAGFFASHTTLLLGIIAAYTAYKTAVIATNVAIAAYNTAQAASIAVDKLKVLWTNNVTAAVQRLYVAVLRHPWAAAAAAVGAMVAALVALAARSDDATEAQRRLKAANAEAEKSAASETTHLRVLYETTQDVTQSLENRTAAAQELQRLYPKVFGNLSTEAILAGNAASAYATLTQNILAAAKARAIEGEIEKIEKENIDIRKKIDEAENSLSTAQQRAERTRDELMRGGEIIYLPQPVINHISNKIKNLNTKLAKNTATQESLYAQAVKLQTSVQSASNAVNQANTNLRTFQTSGTGGGTGGSGGTGGGKRGKRGSGSSGSSGGTGGTSSQTTHTETAQEKANRERQERLQHVNEQLGAEDLTPLARLILENLKRVIEADIQAHPNALLPADRQHAQQRAAAATTAADAQRQAERQTQALADRVAQSIAALSKAGREVPIQAANAPTAEPIGTEMASALGLSEAAANTLAEGVERLNKDMQDGLVTETAYATALQELYTQAQQDTALETLRNKLNEINLAEQRGLITHQQAISLIRQAKAERQAAVEQATPMQTAALPTSQIGQAVAAIAEHLKAKQEATRRIAELEEQGVITHEEAEQRKEEITKAHTANILAATQQMYQMVSNLASGYTTYLNAARDAEVNRVSAAYDQQIKNARSGSKRAKALEEEKQKAIADIKNKYNRRAQTIELAQAIASMSLSAINAYAWGAKLGGPILGAACAALATAAGMLQIAAIKKQHEAQKEGYASGGYTPAGRKYQEAGVVHRGEFVAAQESVQNAAVRPVLDIIDQAQRNGTAARLTSTDLAQAVGTWAAPPATTTVNATTTSDTTANAAQNAANEALLQNLTETLGTLAEKIEQGTLATVAIDGPNGLHKQYTRYKRLRKI